MKRVKVIIGKHPDGCLAYPLGLNGIVVGQGETAADALGDVSSAMRSHIETFGHEALDSQSPVLEAFVTKPDVLV